MIKGIIEIQDIIKTSQQVPKWIIDARAYNIELEALINGKDYKDLLIKIDHKEDINQQEARKRYARSIKFLFEKLLRPTDNIYTATGGSKIIDNENNKLRKKLSQIRDGRSLEKWLQTNWFNVYHTDPNGIILYEWKDDYFYPTYKNISCIRNYESNGQKLEWILFEPTKKDGKEIYRFIDDIADYTFIKEGDNIYLDEENSYDNPFGEVPGVINSDIKILGSELRKSPVDTIIPATKEFLRDLSQKSIFKFLLWSPIFWRYAIMCKECHGTGKTGTDTCDKCVDGFYVKKDITDAVTLPYPENNEVQKVAPDIAGFIIPDVKIIEEFNKELEYLYKECNEVMWGVHIVEEIQKTATEIVMNYQPMINKLNVYADECEYVEQRMTQLAAKFYGLKEDNIIILYGRNYIIEPTEVLLERYEQSKGKGDNTAILDKQLQEYLLSKYKNNPQMLNEEMQRIRIEPFIHYTVEQVNSIWGSEYAQAKMLFAEWWINTDKRNKTTDKLEEEFDEYCLSIIHEDEDEDKETNENGEGNAQEQK